MIDSVHEFARERHQDLLADAERYRLGRSVADRRTASHRLKFLLMRFTRTSHPGRGEAVR